MTTWANKNLYDRGEDRWKEKDSDYSRVNRNRDTMTYYFRSDEVVETSEAGNLVGQAIYNGSPSWYSRTMSTMFQGSLVSKNIPWIRYKMGEFKLKGIDQLDIWLQDIKEYMSDVYDRSNFYDVQPQFTLDGVTTGSPVMFGEEQVLEGRIMWMPQHYKTVRVYYDKYNFPEGVIVKEDNWTAKQVVDRFAKDDDPEGTIRKRKFPLALNRAYEQGLLNEKFTVYKHVFKATDPIWDGQGEGSFVKPSGEWTWLTAYFLELTDSDKDKKNKPLNDNMGDFTQPFTIWNFDKKPHEASSRTPAWYAIWDNLSLQQIDKNYLENIQNMNRPATIALDTMANRLQLGPEGQMLVSEAEYDRSPKPMDRVGGIDFSRELIEMKEDSLMRWFYIKELQMFTNLAADKNQPVTATQIWQMSGEKATLLSPAIETHSRHLETADERMIDLEVRAARPGGPFDVQTMANITDIVNGVLEISVPNVSISPVFIGRLAQAQKISEAIQPIQSGLAFMQPMLDMNPQLNRMIKWYDTANEGLEALDFSQRNIVPKEEYEAAVQADNEAAAAQQQEENAVEMMKASKNIQGPVDESSVMSSVAEAVG